ncbi:MAG: HisA/HisF-related TIM barrel protein [Leucobacter sp.]
MSVFPRVIPALTFRDRLLVKPLRFGKETYIGDPVNAVRIFNEKRVDELVLIDLSASEQPGRVDLEFLEEMASEAFMPVGYGGGVNSAALARDITSLGVEKVVLNSGFAPGGDLVPAISREIGAQSTVVSVDVHKKRFGGYETLSRRGTARLGLSPAEAAQEAVRQGAGEILLQAVDRESTFQGYDLRLIEEVSRAVDVPVVALGGARGVDDFREGLLAGASAVAAGSAFVMQGKHRAVLITYPSPAEIDHLPDTSADATQ